MCVPGLVCRPSPWNAPTISWSPTLGNGSWPCAWTAPSTWSRLESADVEDVRGLVPGTDYVSWVAKLPHNLVLIHDLRTFLSRAESAALAEALTIAPVEKGGQP